MIEIIKIILIFPLFLVFAYTPFSILDKGNDESSLRFLTFNLIINCNILLFLSFLPLPITEYQNLLIILYFLIFVYTSYLHKTKIFIKSYNQLLIFFSSFFILAIVIASNLNLGWDAKFFYYIKSLFFYEGLGLNELSNFEHNKWHPHFGSYLWAFFWKISILDIEYFGRLFYLFIFIFSIYFVSIKISKNTNFNFILFFLILIITFQYNRFSGLQEVLLFSYLLISSKILYDLNSRNKFFSIVIILLICNLMLWIKSEGIVYSAILTIIILFNKSLISKEKVCIILSFIGLFFLKILIYRYYNFETNAQPYNLDYILSIGFNEFFHRIYLITIYLGYYSLKNLLFIFGICLLIFLNFKNKSKIPLTNFNLFFILNIGFIYSAYLFRDLDIEYSLKTTLERLTFTSSSFYLYLIVMYINNKFKFLKSNGKTYK